MRIPASRGVAIRASLCLGGAAYLPFPESKGPAELMNIHEYQAKELLAKFGVAVHRGIAAMSVEEAVAAAKQLPGTLYVVKSQIHDGGRDKGKFKKLGPEPKGGVRLAKTREEGESTDRQI